MKPPDPCMVMAVYCAVGLLLVSVDASTANGTFNQVQTVPPPPLLSGPRARSHLLRGDANQQQQEVSVVPSVISAVETDVNFSSENADNHSTARNGTVSHDAVLELVEAKDRANARPLQNPSVELVSSSDARLLNDEEQQQAVTRTSLKVSEVELEPNDVLKAISASSFQDVVTQTSVKFSRQEFTQEANRTVQNATLDERPEVEKIQEILKKIQDEVGEGRILYVADPKARKGVRVGHQTTEAPVLVDTDYDNQDDGSEYDEYDIPSTTPVSIVQLKKLSLPRNRPTIGRRRPANPAVDTDDKPDTNVIGLKQSPKFSRPAFGILQRPKKPTVAPGPRTVRPFVKVFDRAKARPPTKTVQQIRIRKPGMRITTAKPVRKGFPIGPPKSVSPSDAAAPPSETSLADFEEMYRRQKAQIAASETTTYRTVDEDVPDDFGEPDSQVPLIYYEGQTKISEGWEWSPYVDDRNTKEFKYLAFHVKHQLKLLLDETRYGEFLNYILIDGFSRELVVDFYLVFYKTEPMINDTELTDEVREVMAYKTEENDFEFVLDANSTVFRFKFVKSPATERLVEAPLLPNWAIAMLVFGFGSLILIAGSVIMARNFRSIRRLKTIEKRKQQVKKLQMQMSNIPHRYPEAIKAKDKHLPKKLTVSDATSAGYAGPAGPAGTLDKRPPMLERYQKDYGTYEQKNPHHEELYGSYGSSCEQTEKKPYATNQNTPKKQELKSRKVELPDRYSTVGSHFPSSYKSLLQPSKSILYRPTK